jgi:hypothetical protein
VEVEQTGSVLISLATQKLDAPKRLTDLQGQLVDTPAPALARSAGAGVRHPPGVDLWASETGQLQEGSRP